MLSVPVLLLLCLFAAANSEVLPEQHNDHIDPVKQTGDESEPSDQSKRTIFDSGNVYGIEKHVRLHPSGYKYLLGYRPVKFQFVPVARPLYAKPTLWKAPNLQFSAKPVVTLLPPKTVPVFKPNNAWKFGKLPVNVPPSVPLKPWQQEGWTPLQKDNAPFVPSVPLPEPETTIVPSQSPVIPIIPTSVVPTAFVPQKPVVSFAPFPTLNTVVPVQPPPLVPAPIQPHHVLPAPAVPVQPTVHVSSVQPGVHLNPVQPGVHPVHFDVGGRPLVPINYLPGKLNLPVPDLGVLPLGATVPVQAQAGFVHKVPPQFILPNQHFLQRFPGGFIHQIPPAQPVLPQHIQPVLPQPAPSALPQPILPQHIQPVFPRPAPPVLPQPILPPQPVLPQPAFAFPHQIPQPVPAPQPPHIHIISHQSPQEPVQPVPIPAPQPPPPHPHIHIISHQSPQEHDVQLPAHNFQFFAQNGATQFHHEAVPQFQPQPQPSQFQPQPPQFQPQPQQPDQGYHYDPPLQQIQQEVDTGFFQPGNTDLQIPGFLPEHPHLRQSFTPSQEDPNLDPQNVK